MRTFETLESEVRSYSRSFPTLFTRARGARLNDQTGRDYIDFFAGAGALNYGHNNPALKRRVIEYLESDGVLHSLDMATAAKEEFLERFHSTILRPRGLDYRIQFPGPTGTNAVEAALKLARKVTGRQNVVYFTDGYHGMTLGALAVTGNASKRAGAGVPLGHTVPMPYDGYLGPGVDTLDYFEALLGDPSSGLDLPAAVIVEPIQAEGGVNVARAEWLARLGELARRHGILLIADEIQVGCGRTGPFFCFESAGLKPDLVVLSKSISGLGLPMALVLIRPDLDVWKPGEHNGTFRGNNLAFVAGAAALAYWEDDGLTREVQAKGERVRERLGRIAAAHPESAVEVRGRGLIQGLAFRSGEDAVKVARGAFERGLIIETAGPRDQVLKVLPPLLIERADLDAGLDIIEESAAAALAGTAEAVA
jgi:diaminobutyrate-2-oxoglutarate transaminase